MKNLRHKDAFRRAGGKIGAKSKTNEELHKQATITVMMVVVLVVMLVEVVLVVVVAVVCAQQADADKHTSKRAHTHAYAVHANSSQQVENDSCNEFDV